MPYLFCLLFVALTPLTVWGAGYEPMIALPGFENVNSESLEDYLQTLYVIVIIVAAVVAVGKLMLAGLQYIGDDLITSKQAAKGNIRGAILGLVIIILATVILRTINPNLVTLPFIPDAPSFRDINSVRFEVNIGDRISLRETNISRSALEAACRRKSGKLVYNSEYDGRAGIDGVSKEYICVEPVNSTVKLNTILDNRTADIDTVLGDDGLSASERADLEAERLSVDERRSLERQFRIFVEPYEVFVSDEILAAMISDLYSTVPDTDPRATRLKTTFTNSRTAFLNEGLAAADAEVAALAEAARTHTFFITKSNPLTGIDAAELAQEQSDLCDQLGGSYDPNYEGYSICY